METIEINYKYKPGTRLYRVTYGESLSIMMLNA